MGYSADLTDKQWKQIEPIFASNKGQHLSKYSKRELINAVLYLVKKGYQWRLLPNDFPPHDAVWSFYRRAVQLTIIQSHNCLAAVPPRLIITASLVVPPLSAGFKSFVHKRFAPQMHVVVSGRAFQGVTPSLHPSEYQFYKPDTFY